MLERPSIRQYSFMSHTVIRLTDMSSENLTGAENQQERPGLEQWIVGFVDGEGCFSVPIFRNHTCKLGWQVQPEFAVVQGERSAEVLKDLKQFFGCGRVTVNRRFDDHREDMWRYGVRSLRDLNDHIVPFFEANPLRTAKADDFRKFSVVVRMMMDGAHLTLSGLSYIAGLTETMNHRKPSRFLESSEAIRQPTRLDG